MRPSKKRVLEKSVCWKKEGAGKKVCAGKKSLFMVKKCVCGKKEGVL